jgi:hypothetical protein
MSEPLSLSITEIFSESHRMRITKSLNEPKGASTK